MRPRINATRLLPLLPVLLDSAPDFSADPNSTSPKAPLAAGGQESRSVRITAGFVSGTWRGVTSLTFFAVGLDPVYAGAIWIFATMRTLLRDVFVDKVDGFYKGLYDRLFTRGLEGGSSRVWWEGTKRRAVDIAGRQTENLAALEVIRLFATLGGSDLAKSVFTVGGQADIFLNVGGPGLTRTFLSARRSHAKLTETAKIWWNFNPMLIGNIFQALIWSGASGLDVVHWHTFHVSTALAINMAHDFLLGLAFQRYPEIFNRIAEWQDRGFNRLMARLPSISSARKE